MYHPLFPSYKESDVSKIRIHKGTEAIHEVDGYYSEADIKSALRELGFYGTFTLMAVNPKRELSANRVEIIVPRRVRPTIDDLTDTPFFSQERRRRSRRDEEDEEDEEPVGPPPSSANDVMLQSLLEREEESRRELEELQRERIALERERTRSQLEAAQEVNKTNEMAYVGMLGFMQQQSASAINGTNVASQSALAAMQATFDTQLKAAQESARIADDRYRESMRLADEAHTRSIRQYEERHSDAIRQHNERVSELKAELDAQRTNSRTTLSETVSEHKEALADIRREMREAQDTAKALVDRLTTQLESKNEELSRIRFEVLRLEHGLHKGSADTETSNRVAELKAMVEIAQSIGMDPKGLVKQEMGWAEDEPEEKEDTGMASSIGRVLQSTVKDALDQIAAKNASAQSAQTSAVSPLGLPSEVF